MPVAPAEESLAEADGKGVDGDFAPTRDLEVTELVHEHDDAEDRDERRRVQKYSLDALQHVRHSSASFPRL